MLSISEYKRQSGGSGHGWRVRFKVKTTDKKPYTIYQNVHSTIESEDKEGDHDKLTFNYSEAWEWRKGRSIVDSFIVPKVWRARQKGSYRIQCQIWVEQGKVDKKKMYRGRIGEEPWGLLYGCYTMRKPGPEAITRDVRITWDNLTGPTTFARGEDLTLEVLK